MCHYFFVVPGIKPRVLCMLGKHSTKGLDTSNLMSSVEAETGPTHAQVLRRKEKQEEGISGMQMSRNGQPIGERL